MKYILLAFILMAPDEYDVLVLDENISGITCIQQLDAVAPR